MSVGLSVQPTIVCVIIMSRTFNYIVTMWLYFQTAALSTGTWCSYYECSL